MNIDKKGDKKFSIFDPVITDEHREFYEQIVNELNVILPICNHGKSLALDIGRTAKEQDTIKDLMNRVETFRGELLTGTKNLFGQFYLAKEEFFRMILSTMAYGKINTMDRNLLERTCDVRWWAMETAFCECVEHCNSVRKQFEALDKLLATTLANSAPGKKGTRLGEEDRIQLETFKKEFAEDYKVALSAELFTRLESHFPDIIRLAEKADDANLQDLLSRTLNECRKLHPLVDFACDRLEAINSSYTLYRDLILCDNAGNVIANSNRSNRKRIQGINIADGPWFSQAVATKNGNNYCALDLEHSLLEEQESLVYSTAVRKNGVVDGPVIGALGVFFDFQGEAQIILNDQLPKDKNGTSEEGWYAFFTDSKGRILAGSDEYLFEPGNRAMLPQCHRMLKPGETCSSYVVIGGRESAIFSARTDGYLDYQGLGWYSHLAVLKNVIFDNQSANVELDVDINELMASQITPDINKKTYRHVQKDKRTLQLISTNGILFATELGARGQALGPVFEQITKTGDFATRCMEKLLQEMAIEELALNFRTLQTFSHQAIDLIDRNLFERAADIRWWSTDRYLWEALGSPTEDNYRRASDRLKVINSNYTMYRNLVLANSRGEIVACSNTAQLQRLQNLNVADHEWFVNGIQTRESTEFTVQDLQHSELEKNKSSSLIYAGGVRKGGKHSAEAIGVLGVMFDWDTEAGKMLRCCLPKNRDGKYIPGSVAFYTNCRNVIIESTDVENFPIGSTLQLPPQCSALSNGKSAAGFLEHNGQKYIIGSSKTQGYREYPGLNWCAHVVRPF